MLTVAVLTGRRPDLLADTLDSLVTHHPDVWDQAVRCVVHNSGDPETREILDRYRWDWRTTTTGPLLTIGQASAVMAEQIEAANRPYVLRLEDDQQSRPTEGWLQESVGLLASHMQVRLGAVDQPVLSRCMVCNRQIVWTTLDGGHLTSTDAHFTHRPSLMRTGDYLTLSPYVNERDAQRKMHGAPVAQHVPGVFWHTGTRARSLKWNGGRS